MLHHQPTCRHHPRRRFYARPKYGTSGIRRYRRRQGGSTSCAGTRGGFQELSDMGLAIFFTNPREDYPQYVSQLPMFDF
jgi:hypothetical protein